jgi:hypothetical protein
MTHDLVTKLTALAILTLSLETASALTINLTPENPGLHTNVTLSVSDLSPYRELRYQASPDGTNWHYLDNRGLWWTNTTPVYDCTSTPCALVFPAPGTATAVYVRVVVKDSSGAWHFGTDKTNRIVSWTPQGGESYSLSLKVNGLGCTITPRKNDMSYANANCRARGPYDVHEANIPLVPIGPDGRGRYTSAQFEVVATWTPLPGGVWSAQITYGNLTKACPTSPCTLVVPNQTFDGNYIGRADAVASLTWKEGTRTNPGTEGWPSGLAAEIGIDFMRR